MDGGGSQRDTQASYVLSSFSFSSSFSQQSSLLLHLWRTQHSDLQGDGALDMETDETQRVDMDQGHSTILAVVLSLLVLNDLLLQLFGHAAHSPSNTYTICLTACSCRNHTEG